MRGVGGRTWRKIRTGLCTALVLCRLSAAQADSVVAIVRGTDPDRMVAEAIRLTGGLGDIARGGQRVLIKPNLMSLTDERPYPGKTTTVEVTEAVVRRLRRAARCEIVVGEGGGGGVENMTAFRALGYADMARRHGVRLVDFEMDGFTPVRVNGAAHEEYRLPVALVESDVLINIACLKTHQLAGVTAGMKNLFGFLPMPRSPYHRAMDGVICDLTRARKPDLTILDARVGMEGEGPQFGDPRPVGMIIAGRDVVAVDTVATLVMGHDPERIDYLVMAREAGLGEGDPKRIHVRGVPIEAARRQFKPATQAAAITYRPRPGDHDRVREAADRWVESRREPTSPLSTVAFFGPEHMRAAASGAEQPAACGFEARFRPNGPIEFQVRYPTVHPERRDAAMEEMRAWIRSHLDGEGIEP